MLAISGLSFAFANTYAMDSLNDVVHTATPVESIYGYDATYDLVVSEPLLPKAPYAVSLQNKNLTYTNAVQNVNGFSLTATDGRGGSLSSPNTSSGGEVTNFTAPSSGTVTITINGALTGASCDDWGDGHCYVPNISNSQDIPVSSASVNLNISGMFNSFLSFFHIIDQVEASQ